MRKRRLFLPIAAIAAVCAAGCEALPTATDAPNAGLLFGGHTLGSGHRTDGDSTTATTSSSGETETRGGNLFGSGT
jgi:hypothetical protein